MDDFLEKLVACVVIAFAIAGALLLVDGSFDKTVVTACEKQGYWQTGQTRILCAVEKAK